MARAVVDGAEVIGLIDGYFEWTLSVWHKEILWALTRGVHVFGAASVGALRAVELERYGMRGVGEIFRAYRDGELEDDDEVAVVHIPGQTFACSSEAMVNIGQRSRRQPRAAWSPRLRASCWSRSPRICSIPIGATTASSSVGARPECHGRS